MSNKKNKNKSENLLFTKHVIDNNIKKKDMPKEKLENKEILESKVELEKSFN